MCPINASLFPFRSAKNTLYTSLTGPLFYSGYRVVKFIGTPTPGVESQFSIQCSLEFDTTEHFQEALKAKGEKVLGDVPNFSNKDPVLMVGDEVVRTD